MKNILSLRFKNILSFRDENTVSFVADSKYHSKGDTAERWNLITNDSIGKTRILPVVGVYGHNASGKTNLLRIIAVLTHLLERRVKTENFPFFPFMANDTSRNESSEIGIEAVVGDYYLDYEIKFSYIKKEIESEKLTVFLNGKSQKYERNSSGFKARVDFVSKDAQKEISDLSGRKDLTALEVLYLRGIKPFSDLYIFLHGLLDGFDLQKKLEHLYTDNKERDKLIEAIKEIDLGITGIKIKKIENAIKEDVPSKNILAEHMPKYYYDVIFDHSGYSLPSESVGTDLYFRIMLIITDFFENGGIAIIDELQKSLHPLLQKRIIGMFHNKNINKAGAQLLFSSHDVSVLKPDILRRDEIYFAEKEYDGASTVYPLNGFRGLRNHTDYGKSYLEGKFGAVPVLKGLFNGKM